MKLTVFKGDRSGRFVIFRVVSRVRVSKYQSRVPSKCLARCLSVVVDPWGGTQLTRYAFAAVIVGHHQAAVVGVAHSICYVLPHRGRYVLSCRVY